jgi:hypothetical protein
MEKTRFVRTAFPEFRIRGDASQADGSRWVHLGTDDTYIALINQSTARFVQYLSDNPASGGNVGRNSKLLPPALESVAW